MAMEEVGMASRCCSSGAAQELHVLAVDDSLVDRKVIERLLKISCCKGLIFSCFLEMTLLHLGIFLVLGCWPKN
jgi:hypothetical protein